MFENLPYFSFDTRFDGEQAHQTSVADLQLKKMLAGSAHLKINEGLEFEHIEIELIHIKPQGLPTSYLLKYIDGNLINDQDASLLIQQLEPGDFLDINRIAPPGQPKQICFYLKAN